MSGVRIQILSNNKYTDLRRKGGHGSKNITFGLDMHIFILLVLGDQESFQKNDRGQRPGSESVSQSPSRSLRGRAQSPRGRGQFLRGRGR